MAATVGNYELSKADLKRLCDPEGLLNDTVVNAYLTRLITTSPRVFAFDSQFTALPTHGWPRFLKKVNLLGDHDLLLLPVCNHMHWYLLVVDTFACAIRVYNSMDNVAEDGDAVRLLRDFLAARHPGAGVSHWPLIRPIEYVPQQTNTADCGVFVCHFAQCAVRRVACDAFSQDDVPDKRFEMAKELTR